MFLHSHLYFSQKVFGQKMNDLIALGSFLPDIRITKVIDWQESHTMKQAEKLDQFIQTTKTEYLPLVKGIKSHIILDEFSHHSFKGKTGYAFQKCPPLVEITRRACRLNKKLAERVAHNFIEIAVDFLLLKDNPDLIKIKLRVIKNTNKQDLSLLLSQFFHQNKKKMIKSLNDYFALLGRYDMNSLDSWVNVLEEVNKLNFNLGVERKLVKKAIIQAIGLIKNSYLDFLSEASRLYLTNKGGK